MFESCVMVLECSASRLKLFLLNRVGLVVSNILICRMVVAYHHNRLATNNNVAVASTTTHRPACFSFLGIIGLLPDKGGYNIREPKDIYGTIASVPSGTARGQRTWVLLYSGLRVRLSR